jgi:hypothetical protein
MSCLSDELELIKNIYFEEISIVSASNLKYEFKLIELIIKFPEDYPFSKPIIAVPKNPSIESQLKLYSESLIGQEMIYDLLEKFKILVEEIKDSKETEPAKIDIRSFIDESPFSIDKFLQLIKSCQRASKKSTENLELETGKQFFLKLKRKEYIESEIYE